MRQSFGFFFFILHFLVTRNFLFLFFLFFRFSVCQFYVFGFRMLYLFGQCCCFALACINFKFFRPIINGLNIKCNNNSSSNYFTSFGVFKMRLNSCFSVNCPPIRMIAIYIVNCYIRLIINHLIKLPLSRFGS